VGRGKRLGACMCFIFLEKASNNLKEDNNKDKREKIYVKHLPKKKRKEREDGMTLCV
jgi:hypothetical protein